jgi:branched-chain amino acid transport system permease protein
MMRDPAARLIVGVFGAVLAAGFLLPQWTLLIVTIAIAKGLVVLGLVLLLRAGLVSFGQGLFYCLGAYAAGAGSKLLGVSDALLLLSAGGLCAALLAAILGFLLANYRGIFFGLLSLALSMILYGLLVKSQALGSTDGFNLAARTLFGLRFDASGKLLLGLSCAVALLAGLALQRYLATPLGRLAEAIRDNEIRVEYMGASVRNAIHVKYVIAAALAGVGGALAAVAIGHIDPELAYWTTSGEFVFIAILGGAGHVLAPFLGALVFGIFYTVAFGASPYTWQMELGFALLLCISFLPLGLWSLFARRRSA